MRTPKCIYLRIAKSADENDGITLWHCVKFDIDWLTFIQGTSLIDKSSNNIFDVSGQQNPELFKECKRCPHRYSQQEVTE